MPIEKIHIDQFLTLAATMPILDVRSPSEFLHAHIPGAYSLPIFSDEERKAIGTAYKKQSRKIAVNIGLNSFSSKMKSIEKEAMKYAREFPSPAPNDTAAEPSFLLHCWRGGMRSGTIAWLLNLYGYQVYVLEGGYKSYRKWVLTQLEKEYDLHILGGYTGSGKTEHLLDMKNRGYHVIDLEGLANHRGSSFGALGMERQPSQEMFENKLAAELLKIQNEQVALTSSDDDPVPSTIWLEDESRHIGSVGFPLPFWEQMRNSPYFFMDVPLEERLTNIIRQYGKFPVEDLEASILKIQKRLGGLDTKNALMHLQNGDLKACFEILIQYYDKLYRNGVLKHQTEPVVLNKDAFESVSLFKNNGLRK